MTIRTTFGRLHRSLHQVAVWMLLLPVFVYRRVLSPLKRTPTCRYVPTCSEYAIEAVKTRGIVVGSALAVFRILRCNPLFHGGYHPVSCAVDHHHRHRHAPQELS